MYYIFNLENKIIGCCDFEPDLYDLESRDEYCLFSEVEHNDILNLELTENGIIVKQQIPKSEQDILEEKTKDILGRRNTLLTQTDWMFNRHLEQTMLKVVTNLTEEQFTKLIEYRQALRDITDIAGFPEINLPTLVLEE